MQIHKLQFSTVSVVRSAAFALLLALASAAFGQTFDTSGNGTLKGAYFARELLLTGQNGSSVAAISVVGTMTFDGNGNYTFSGKQSKQGGAMNADLSLNGTYKAAGNGFVMIQSLADPTDSENGGYSRPTGPNRSQ